MWNALSIIIHPARKRDPSPLMLIERGPSGGLDVMPPKAIASSFTR